jgi:hypothetical protein
MKPQLIKKSLIENLYKENNKKIFNSINLENNIFFNILIIFFLLFCFIFLFYRYSNNKLSKEISNKSSKQKFVNNKIPDYFINDNMLNDIQKYKELSNKYNLE